MATLHTAHAPAVPASSRGVDAYSQPHLRADTWRAAAAALARAAGPAMTADRAWNDRSSARLRSPTPAGAPPSGPPALRPSPAASAHGWPLAPSVVRLRVRYHSSARASAPATSARNGSGVQSLALHLAADRVAPTLPAPVDTPLPRRSAQYTARGQSTDWRLASGD